MTCHRCGRWSVSVIGGFYCDECRDPSRDRARGAFRCLAEIGLAVATGILLVELNIASNYPVEGPTQPRSRGLRAFYAAVGEEAP